VQVIASVVVVIVPIAMIIVLVMVVSTTVPMSVVALPFVPILAASVPSATRFIVVTLVGIVPRRIIGPGC
jgi:hypothetical protein